MKRFYMWIPEDMETRVAATAAKEGLDKSKLIRLAVSEYLLRSGQETALPSRRTARTKGDDDGNSKHA